MISFKRTGVLCVALMTAAVRLQAATSLTFGTTYAGTIAVPGQTNLYTFTGSAGQRLFLNALDADGVSLNFSLISPGGLFLYQRNDDYNAGPWILQEPGTFSLVVSGNTSATGNYQFRLLDLASVPALPIGTSLVDQLSPPLAANLYQFTGKRGQRINLQSISYSTNQAQWELVSPANLVINSGQIYQNLGTNNLPMDGQYCLIVMGTTAGTTPLTFQLLATDVSDTAVAASGFGTPHAGTISANQTNTFTYTAPAGLPVYFDNLDTSGQSLVVDLMDPTGNAAFSISEIQDAGPYVLPRSGTYTLNVRGPGGASGNYNFRLLDLSSAPALPLNTSVSNQLSSPYQTDVYQLAGTAGQRLYFDSAVNNSVNVQVHLLAPDGQNPISTSFNYDAGPNTLQLSGPYYLFVQSGISSGTSYQFTMLDAATQPTLPINIDQTGTLPANTAQIYRLAGTAGEKLYFYGKAVSGGGTYWTLFDPRNVPINGANLSGDFQSTLPYTGNYLVIFTGAGTSVTYSNQVSTFAFTTNALTLGTTVTNNLLNPGDQLVYSFTGTAGQQVYFDSLIQSSWSSYVTLVSPTGVQLFSSGAIYDVGPYTLPQTGTYQLVFSGSGRSTGPISFELMDVGAQPALPLNNDITGTLAPNTSQLFRLSGTPG